MSVLQIQTIVTSMLLVQTITDLLFAPVTVGSAVMVLPAITMMNAQTVDSTPAMKMQPVLIRLDHIFAPAIYTTSEMVLIAMRSAA